MKHQIGWWRDPALPLDLPAAVTSMQRLGFTDKLAVLTDEGRRVITRAELPTWPGTRGVVPQRITDPYADRLRSAETKDDLEGFVHLVLLVPAEVADDGAEAGGVDGRGLLGQYAGLGAVDVDHRAKGGLAGVGGFIVAYDPTWVERFEGERRAVLGVLGPVAVEHIGSTAIPGIRAKPVIDMMAGTPDAADAAQRLARVGYRTRPHRKDAVLCERDGYSLQLTIPGSRLWVERLAFRNAVRADPALRAEYQALKERLLAESDGKGYTATGKRDFVRAVLAAAGVELEDGMYVDR